MHQGPKHMTRVSDFMKQEQSVQGSTCHQAYYSDKQVSVQLPGNKTGISTKINKLQQSIKIPSELNAWTTQALGKYYD
jgi:hypothetical protein